eukprot:CAMPEP_0119140064 /NCGR_PEP_ID=MMETSP1310-20130426/28608_1 /TAXON_ID=464262 /ORGANISM="Genus nov. species nov., Strain RCC2339" /LENGTH=126 /DNA_ID=CAMNT_0007131395 /DNA_START=8 /DNA_END=385 /DNA_ORIENTATION=-
MKSTGLLGRKKKEAGSKHLSHSSPNIHKINPDDESKERRGKWAKSQKMKFSGIFAGKAKSQPDSLELALDGEDYAMVNASANARAAERPTDDEEDAPGPEEGSESEPQAVGEPPATAAWVTAAGKA